MWRSMHPTGIAIFLLVALATPALGAAALVLALAWFGVRVLRSRARSRAVSRNRAGGGFSQAST
jgi:hypothetical protein